MHRKFIVSLAVFACALLGVLPAAAQFLPAPDANSVLILAPTVTGGAGSLEGTFAAAIPRTVVVASAAQWASITAADFATYRAIILGDPTCTGLGPEAAATANGAVWGPTVNGNVVIWGTDPVFHSTRLAGPQGGDQVTDTGVRFASDLPTRTGAYITLSCYYHGVAPGTPVPLLNNAFGPGFTVKGVGCFNDAHLVATSPALTGLTDAIISNWSCSVHEAFDSWPASFDVLAIARGAGAEFNAPDGTVGTPYVIARGVTLISNLDLTPDEATNEIGQKHGMKATVTEDPDGPGGPQPPAPVVGTKVTFEVEAGPHAGTLGSGITDAAGCAFFSYIGTALGDDFIKASYVDSRGATQFDRAIKHWIPRSNLPPDCSGAMATIEDLCRQDHQFVPVVIFGVSDPDGDPVTITVTGITQDEPLMGKSDKTCPDGKILDGNAHVRAEQSGNKKAKSRRGGSGGKSVKSKNGRVYVVSFSADDGRGGKCEGSVSVCVPHKKSGKSCKSDKSHKSGKSGKSSRFVSTTESGRDDGECVDDGQLFNSLGPCMAPGHDPDLIASTDLTVRADGRESVVSYSLKVDADVNLSVFDLAGRRVATIENTRKGPGTYTVTSPTGLTRGMYFYRLQVGKDVVTKTVLHAE